MVSHSGSEKYYSTSERVTIYVWAYICRLFIVVDVVDISGQAKVCDLHDVALRDQDIPGCKVSVYTLGRRGTTRGNSENQHFTQNDHKTWMVPAPAAGQRDAPNANMSD